jgi:hypothetical protein
VRHAVPPGDWAASIDLKDVYFFVPIARDARKYLQFGWRGRLFQFCILPFGLSPGGFQDQLLLARLLPGPRVVRPAGQPVAFFKFLKKAGKF